VVVGTMCQSGSFGVAAPFSFNVNQIITTSGGGMVVTADEQVADRVRYLSAQAFWPMSHYQHLAIGFNYRRSNLLTALGRSQLRGLPDKSSGPRQINQSYRNVLGDLPGISFDPAVDGRTCWLTCVRIAHSRRVWSTGSRWPTSRATHCGSPCTVSRCWQAPPQW